MYLGDYRVGQVVYVPFHTFSSANPAESMTITGLALADIKIYKSGGTTQRASTAGFTLLDTDGIDFDSIVGIHGFSIDTSDDTTAGFFVGGADYFIVVDQVTLDSGTISFVSALFSIENRRVAGELMSTTIATLASQISFTLTAGSAENDTYNNCTIIISDLASSVQKAVGFISDYVGSSKTVSLAVDPGIFTMAVGDHVSILATSAIPYGVWREILTGGTQNVVNSAGRRLRTIQEAGGYSGGYIYIDTVNGVAGTTDFENGVDINPVDSIADANTLAASLGISQFRIAAGSSITLAAAQNNQVFEGEGWSLALGGQDIAGSTFMGATVTGIAAGTGTHQDFVNCHVGASTHLKDTTFRHCAITGTITAGEAGDYFFTMCYSGIAGNNTWTFDFAAVGTTALNMRNYSGGIQLENMGDSGTDTASIEGQGNIIEGTCSGGAVTVRGCFTVSGVTNITFTEGARIDKAGIVDEWEVQSQADPGGFHVNVQEIVDSATAALRLQIASDTMEIGTVDDTVTPTTVMFECSDITEADANHYMGRTIIFTSGNLAKQATTIEAYALVSGRGRFTVAAMTEAPADSDTLIII